MKMSCLFAVVSLALANMAGCGSGGSATVEIRNFSYDPTRELYTEINQAFAKAYQAKHQVPIVVTQSHGGSAANPRGYR